MVAHDHQRNLLKTFATVHEAPNTRRNATTSYVLHMLLIQCDSLFYCLISGSGLFGYSSGTSFSAASLLLLMCKLRLLIPSLFQSTLLILSWSSWYFTSRRPLLCSSFYDGPHWIYSLVLMNFLKPSVQVTITLDSMEPSWGYILSMESFLYIKHQIPF